MLELLGGDEKLRAQVLNLALLLGEDDREDFARGVPLLVALLLVACAWLPIAPLGRGPALAAAIRLCDGAKEYRVCDQLCTDVQPSQQDLR